MKVCNEYSKSSITVYVAKNVKFGLITFYPLDFTYNEKPLSSLTLKSALNQVYDTYI